MNEYKITKYSSYNQYLMTEGGTNCSDVVTKLVQLAGRLCESYASDIAYDIESFKKAVEGGTPYLKLLGFREHGVNEYNVEDTFTVFMFSTSEVLQWWLLFYNPETKKQYLNRVQLSNVRDWPPFEDHAERWKTELG